MAKYFCTVFTPAYNRALLLKRLYKSLTEQKFKDFEWVVVDDGSTDDTEYVVKTFVDENKIDIKYIKVKNGGKHRAINVGVKMSNGKVFAIVDSDDYLANFALEKIHAWFDEIEEDKSLKYCGVAGTKGYNENQMIGSTFDGEYLDATNIQRKRYNIFGDKFEVYYTDVMREYEFPEYEGEKFMSEIVVWTRMARDGYYIRWHQDILYLCNYLEGGLTDNNLRLLSNNPRGYALRIREQVRYAELSLKEKWGYYSNYFFLRRKKERFSEMCKNIEASCIEMLCAIVLRFVLMIQRGNFNEYKDI